jgi:dihydrofolate synthase / folylpolyglutamate synthase
MPTSQELLADLKRLHPLLIDLSLGRIERLLAKLDNPQHRLAPVVHIAGTNGKGSTAAFLKAMLEAAGRRVHVYTSPHLVRFHERIALAAEEGPACPIGEDRLVELLQTVKRASAGDAITFFEVTTAAALVAFAETPADYVILEVGLGGRLDATNVVTRPALTVITPVALDHRDKLGETLAEIAAEKAGILKRGVTGIIAPQAHDALAVIQREADRAHAPLQVAKADYDAYEQGGRLVFQSAQELLDLPKPALLGRHQIVNAGTAVAAALELHDPALDGETIGQGLLDVEWPARMQPLKSGVHAALLRSGSELWLDGSHNPSAAAAIAQTLADLEDRASKPLHLIVGMLASKDAAGFMAAFRGLARGVITVPLTNVEEGAGPPEQLAAIARQTGLEADTAPDVQAAIRRIEQKEPGSNRILICGSLYLAGHVLAVEEQAQRKSD